MPLNTTQLKTTIKQALLEQRDIISNPEDAADQLAGKLAKAFEAYVKQLTIEYIAGLASPSGAVTGTFQYNLS